MTSQPERRGVFGEAADDYEKATQSPAEYRLFLLTTSPYRMLDRDREAVPADTTALIDAHEGGISGLVCTDLARARRV
jgi:hypothetical protein